MSRRRLSVLLPIVVGVFAPLGCSRWQCCVSQMMTPSNWIRPCTNPGGVCGGGPSATGGDLNTGQTAQLCLQTAQSLEKQGYLTEAIRQYETARQYDPQVKTVSRRLAVLYDKQGDAQRAEAEYERALQEQSGDAELLNDLGYFHYRHDHLQIAENWLRNAVNVNPNLPCAWINLGQVLACQGRSEESYQAFARVLKPAEAYSNLGVLLAKQGHTAEARGVLQKAVSLDANLEQPRAVLKALKDSPSPLPPGLTKNTPTSSPAPTMTTSLPVKKPMPASPELAETMSTTNRSRPASSSVKAAPSSLPSLPAVRSAPCSVTDLLPTSTAPTTSTTRQTSAKPTAPASAVSADLPIILHGPVRPLPVSSKPNTPPSTGSDLPVIVNKREPTASASPPTGTLPPASVESMISRTSATDSPTSRGMPMPPPPPPPPPPIVPRPLSSAKPINDSSILRTSAWSTESSTPPIRPAKSKAPRLLPTPPELRLLPVPESSATTESSTAHKPKPQATLTDCQAVKELEDKP
jgi:Tfp pilus assembly protein PilF